MRGHRTGVGASDFRSSTNGYSRVLAGDMPIRDLKLGGQYLYRILPAQRARNLDYVAQVRAAASPENIQPRHTIGQFAILARAFGRFSRVELRSRVELGMASARGIGA